MPQNSIITRMFLRDSAPNNPVLEQPEPVTTGKQTSKPATVPRAAANATTATTTTTTTTDTPTPTDNKNTVIDPLPFILLAPLQSCQIHGWLNPKRTLDWDDMCHKSGITLRKCMQSGVSATQLKSLQPDVQMWIRHKGVTLSDVPAMLEWPLHPVYDLQANVSDLATMHYSPTVMARLGITYDFLRNIMGMDDDWMRVLRYSPREWAQMGFTREDAMEMGVQRVQWVFSMDYDALVLQVSSVLRL